MLITHIIDDICLHKALIFPPHSLTALRLQPPHVCTYSTSDLSTPTCVCTIKAMKWAVVSSTMDYT